MHRIYRRKKLIYGGIVALIVAIAVAGYEWQQFLAGSLLPKGTSVAYELKSKTTINHFAKDLQTFEVIGVKKRYLLTLLGYIRGDIHHLKAGEYLIEGGYSPSEVLNKLVTGDVIKRHITFVEGWTFKKMLAAIKANPYLRHTTSALSSEEIMAILGHPKISPEGQFFPDTYMFTRGVSDIVILKKAHALMQVRFQKAWNNRSPNVPYQTPYQAMIAASIIEKESGYKPERPLIAGVLLNRLRTGMPLQMDSTVSYGLGGTLHLTKADLMQESPYNSYLNKGWPPTPIAMPSLDAIHAALHPRATPFIYFVSTGHGQHHFSVSLKEHYIAVARYKKEIKKSGDKMTSHLFSLLSESNKEDRKYYAR